MGYTHASPLFLLVVMCLVGAPIAHAASPQDIADAALARLRNAGPLLRSDCSGLVMTVLHDVGVPIKGSARTYWADAVRDQRVREGEPAVGDLVFFDKTYDANRNGLVDDELTHMAIVTAIDADGTVRMVHWGSGWTSRLLLNTRHPNQTRHNGKIINSFLRARHYGPKRGQRLASQLLRGFARPPLSERSSIRVKADGNARGAPSSARQSRSATEKQDDGSPSVMSGTRTDLLPALPKQARRQLDGDERRCRGSRALNRTR